MSKPLVIRSGAERRAFEEMANGGLLYVYTGERGAFCPPPWPAEGSGAIVYDGPPRHVGQRIVRRLEMAGAEWCPRLKACVFDEAAKRRVHTVLAGRDVLWISSDANGIAGAAHV
jgi:hypothetical protein